MEIGLDYIYINQDLDIYEFFSIGTHLIISTMIILFILIRKYLSL